MAPATLESASPIGIANVSLQLILVRPRLLNADELIPASKPAVRFQQAMRAVTCGDADISLRHKIVAKRGAAFTIMVGHYSNLSQSDK